MYVELCRIGIKGIGGSAMQIQITLEQLLEPLAVFPPSGLCLSAFSPSFASFGGMPELEV
jgi:hypothetical protein